MYTGATVNAVTRSGSNQNHGTLFEFARHHSMNATSELARDHVISLSQSNPPSADAPKDAQRSVPIIFRLEAFQPLGAQGTLGEALRALPG